MLFTRKHCNGLSQPSYTQLLQVGLNEATEDDLASGPTAVPHSWDSMDSQSVCTVEGSQTKCVSDKNLSG